MIWTTQDGKKIDIKDMSDRHLFNTILYMRRRVQQLHHTQSLGWSIYCRLQGEMAEYYVEQDLNNIGERIVEAEHIVQALRQEQMRRKTLKPWSTNP